MKFQIERASANGLGEIGYPGVEREEITYPHYSFLCVDSFDELGEAMAYLRGIGATEIIYHPGEHDEVSTVSYREAEDIK